MLSEHLAPYVGPRPFEASDREFFFGRSREIRRIVDLIYVNRVLLIYSPSGAGKTLLLNAGVIPTLEKDGFEIFPVGRVGGFLPNNVEPEDIQNIFRKL